MTKETILVSAYITDLFDVPNAGINSYIQWASPLLMHPCKKVIFIDSDIFDEVNQRPKNNNTTLISFDKKILEEWWVEKSDVIMPSNLNKLKDTFRYMRVQMYKVMWLLEVINMFDQEDQFMWLDFGYFKLLNGDIELYNSSLTNAVSKNYDKIRIASFNIQIINVPDNKKDAFVWFKDNNYIDNVTFFLLGGIFGGKGSKIKIFADEVEKWKNELILQNAATWEVQVWWFIFLKNPDMFDTYNTQFHTLLSNY